MTTGAMAATTRARGETVTSRTFLLGATESSPVSTEARGCPPLTHPSTPGRTDLRTYPFSQSQVASEKLEGMNTTASVPALLTQRGRQRACAATATCCKAHAHQ